MIVSTVTGPSNWEITSFLVPRCGWGVGKTYRLVRGNSSTVGTSLSGKLNQELLGENYKYETGWQKISYVW